ncbi:glycosyltransferase family 25 protein [Bradyrhizobium diazoefficiens]|nr:glycosyltransferase family 25 protein [Bradyrhizobium diazoefficiens]MBR0774094.1 glycosyltransferase family 25 protein [Bradyrhizobium diazoefficiens]
MKNFVVNLDRQPEKYETFLKRNAGCGIAFNRFAAVDGSKLTNEEVMAMGIVAPGSKFAPGTVGGTASMSQIWKQVAEQDEPALVFEDDCTIRHDINERLATLLPTLGDFDVLVLGYNTDSILDVELAPALATPGLEQVPSMKAMMVFRPQRPDDRSDAVFQRSTSQVAAFRLNACFGPGGYVLSPAGARRMYPYYFPMDNRMVTIEALGNRALMSMGADMMGNSIYRYVKAYACVAPLVVPRNNAGASTTQSHVPSAARVWG